MNIPKDVMAWLSSLAKPAVKTKAKAPAKPAPRTGKATVAQLVVEKRLMSKPKYKGKLEAVPLSETEMLYIGTVGAILIDAAGFYVPAPAGDYTGMDGTVINVAAETTPEQAIATAAEAATELGVEFMPKQTEQAEEESVEEAAEETEQAEAETAETEQAEETVEQEAVMSGENAIAFEEIGEEVTVTLPDGSTVLAEPSVDIVLDDGRTLVIDGESKLAGIIEATAAAALSRITRQIEKLKKAPPVKAPDQTALAKLQAEIEKLKTKQAAIERAAVTPKTPAQVHAEAVEKAKTKEESVALRNRAPALINLSKPEASFMSAFKFDLETRRAHYYNRARLSKKEKAEQSRNFIQTPDEIAKTALYKQMLRYEAEQFFGDFAYAQKNGLKVNFNDQRAYKRQKFALATNYGISVTDPYYSGPYMEPWISDLIQDSTLLDPANRFITFKNDVITKANFVDVESLSPREWKAYECTPEQSDGYSFNVTQATVCQLQRYLEFCKKELFDSILETLDPTRFTDPNIPPSIMDVIFWHEKKNLSSVLSALFLYGNTAGSSALSVTGTCQGWLTKVRESSKFDAATQIIPKVAITVSNAISVLENIITEISDARPEMADLISKDPGAFFLVMSPKDFLAIKQAMNTIGWGDRYNKADTHPEGTLMFNNIMLVSDSIMTNGQMFGTYSRAGGMSYGSQSNMILLTDEFSDAGVFESGRKNAWEDIMFIKSKFVIGNHAPHPEFVFIVQ